MHMWWSWFTIELSSVAGYAGVALGGIFRLGRLSGDSLVVVFAVGRLWGSLGFLFVGFQGGLFGLFLSFFVVFVV